MHGIHRDPLFARADDAIDAAHRLLAEADLLLAQAYAHCRDAEQSRTLQSGLPAVWSIDLLVRRNAFRRSAWSNA